MISKSHIIETQRLLLRLPVMEEIPVVYAATKYKGFNDGMLWEPPERQEDLIKSFENIFKSWEEGEGYSFSLTKKADRSFIGRISIKKTFEPNMWNIGFWTHPMHQNQGYMSEAAPAMIKFGFEELNAEKIIACHALWNKASESVLKKSGMKFLKYIEKGFQKKGIWMEENLLEINRLDWRESVSS